MKLREYQRAKVCLRRLARKKCPAIPPEKLKWGYRLLRSELTTEELEAMKEKRK